MQLVGQSFDLEPLWAETNSHLRVALIQCRFPWRVSSLSLPLVISTPGAFIVVLWNVPEWKTPLFFTCKSLLSSPTASPFCSDSRQTDIFFELSMQSRWRHGSLCLIGKNASDELWEYVSDKESATAGDIACPARFAAAPVCSLHYTIEQWGTFVKAISSSSH